MKKKKVSITNLITNLVERVKKKASPIHANKVSKLPWWALFIVAVLLKAATGISDAVATKAISVLANVDAIVAGDIDVMHQLIIYTVLSIFTQVTGVLDSVESKEARIMGADKIFTKWLSKALRSYRADIITTTAARAKEASMGISQTETEMLQYIANSASVIGSIGVVFGSISVIECIVIIVSIIIAAIMICLSEALFHFDEQAKRAKGLMHITTLDVYTNLDQIKAMGAEEYSIRRNTEAQEQAVPYHVNKPRTAWFGLANIVVIIAMLVVMWLEYSAGNVSNVMLVGINIFQVVMAANYIVTGLGLAQEIESYKKQLKYLRGNDVAKEDKKSIVDLGAIKYNFSFEAKMMDPADEEKITIAKFDTDIEFSAGDIVCLFGRTGSGKSVLLNMITGGVEDDRIVPLQTMMCSNLTPVLCDSVKKNISFDLGVTDAEVEEVLRSLEMGEWLDNLTNGLSTTMEEAGKNLSGGQKNRLHLAKLFIDNRVDKRKNGGQSRKVYVADELFANLDPHTAKIVAKVLKKEFAGATLIFVDHSGTIGRLANKFICVETDHTSHMASASEYDAYVKEATAEE